MLKATTKLPLLLCVAALSCSNPDTLEEAPSSSFIETADCVDQCHAETACLTGAIEEDIDDYCKTLCRLSVKALTCQYDAFSTYCKNVYKDYHDCYYDIDECDDFITHAVKMRYADDTDGEYASRKLCTKEIEHLWSYCYTGEEMNSVSKKCGDDLNDYVDFRDDTILEPAPDAGVENDTDV